MNKWDKTNKRPRDESWEHERRQEHLDEYGEVFNYPALYIGDGSVMPGPVGPNPSLTIAALANRFADRPLEKTRGATGSASVARRMTETYMPEAHRRLP